MTMDDLYPRLVERAYSQESSWPKRLNQQQPRSLAQKRSNLRDGSLVKMLARTRRLFAIVFAQIRVSFIEPSSGTFAKQPGTTEHDINYAKNFNN